ncbi:hypothetical protein Rs2_21544 [Raphanus sativus]|nr:hypothetical protein Rs2_21544 [Raphanus sativus]
MTLTRENSAKLVLSSSGAAAAASTTTSWFSGIVRGKSGTGSYRKARRRWEEEEVGITDAQEIDQLISYLINKENSEGVVLLGHSTGCQDIGYYMGTNAACS